MARPMFEGQAMKKDVVQFAEVKRGFIGWYNCDKRRG